MEQQFLKAFLEDSSEFAGITISGHFDIDITVFAAIYEHYRETGENLLDEYALVYKESWMPEEDINLFEYIKRLRAIYKVKSLGVIDDDYIRYVYKLVESKHQSYLNSLK